ncbi:MAG: DUF493 domain-containing protein [Flavobacteriales bacterium]|jgi:putative lipoic acid-binding regulatory protein|nr:DUF493 domain-containing protein [Flavobacteriales bacterium]
MSQDPKEELFQGLKAKLKEQKWPASYLFKFIVKQDDVGKLQKVKDCFDGSKYESSVKQSKNGKYISLSIKVKKMYSPEAVIEKYMKVAELEGVISL